MTETLQIIVFPLLAYLIGSISSAILISKVMNLPDPRKIGSGNPGATNVLRSGNKNAAFLTLLCDLLKGFIPVALTSLTSNSPAVLSLVAIAAFMGHLYPVYYGFKGGKGVATAIGIFLGLNIYIFVAFALTWMAAAFLSRMSSFAALAASAIALVSSILFWQNLPVVGAIFVIVAFIFLKHRSNIERIVAGTESKIGEKTE